MDYFDWYAAYLHRTCPVVDAHLDLVTEVYRRRKAGGTGILKQYYKREFLKSGVNLVVASLFLGTDELEDCREDGSFRGGALLKKSMDMLAAFYADLEEARGLVELVADRDSFARIAAKRSLSRHHAVGVLLYLEGLDMLEGKPELLRCFHAMGVRGAALAWNQRPELPNVFALGCGVGGEENSAITDKGVEAIRLMERLGMFVDSSHLCRRAAYLLPSFAKKPFAATHSNADAMLSHRRNLTDDEIGEIAKRGGVIGVNAYHEFVVREDSDRFAIDALCDHVTYLIEKAGEDHVGFGLDLGEGNLLSGYRELPKVTAELLRRGYCVERVKKVLGGNWIRFLTEVLGSK